MKIWEKMGHPLGGKASEKMTVQSFKATENNINLCKFMDGFDKKTDNAYIFGPVGAGKTHAATALASKNSGLVMKLYQIGRFVRWGMMQNGLDEGNIIGLFSGENISTNEFFGVAADMLVIDDLGSEKLTEFTEQILFEIIDMRISKGLNGLIITSNISLPGMAKRLKCERITSRIAGLCNGNIFSLEGEDDHRFIKQPENKNG